MLFAVPLWGCSSREVNFQFVLLLKSVIMSLVCMLSAVTCAALVDLRLSGECVDVSSPLWGTDWVHEVHAWWYAFFFFFQYLYWPLNSATEVLHYQVTIRNPHSQHCSSLWPSYWSEAPCENTCSISVVLYPSHPQTSPYLSSAGVSFVFWLAEYLSAIWFNKL